MDSKAKEPSNQVLGDEKLVKTPATEGSGQYDIHALQIEDFICLECCLDQE